MQQIPFELLAIALLILINAFFAGAEISTISVRRSQILNLINSGSKRAQTVKRFIEQPDSFLATIQVGVTLAGTTASVLAGSAVVPTVTDFIVRLGVEQKTAEKEAMAFVVVLLSYLLLVVGELLPKYLAYAYPRRLALFSAPVVDFFSKIVYLPVRALSLSARLLLLPFGLPRRQRSGAFTEEEINLILSEGETEGRFEQSERELIKGVFEFADTTVRQAMTPRVEVAGIDLATPDKEVLRTVTAEGYSRYPVYDKTLDNIKGVLHSKDLINLLVHSEVIVLHDLIRPIRFIPDSKPISDLLREFQLQQHQMAIVLDEFGGTAGLITMEDILEEIVGEIRDEHDKEVEPFTIIDDKTCVVQARYPIEDFNEKFGVALDEEAHVDTVGGHVFNNLGKLPRRGQKVVIDNLEFEIISLVGARIDLMKVRKIAPEDSDQSD